jgi:hypothetical protein
LKAFYLFNYSILTSWLIYAGGGEVEAYAAFSVILIYVHIQCIMNMAAERFNAEPEPKLFKDPL